MNILYHSIQKFRSFSYFFTSLMIGFFLGSCAPEQKNTPPKKPNILFILVDDLGKHDLGVTGSTYYETPNIDDLAQASSIFTQGYACSRVCSPSRASIITGQFTARHGITDWIGAKYGEAWRTHNRSDLTLPASYQPNLPQSDLTIAEAFKESGYSTFFAGKWHLGNVGSYPENHGFDFNIGGWEKGSPIGGYFSPWENPNLPNQKEGENLSMRLAKETASFINNQSGEPFFAFLSFYAVHGPIQTTEGKWNRYREKILIQGVDSTGFRMEKNLPIRKKQDNPIYAGLIEQMDDAVGVVLKALKTSGLDQNTIVVFTSDNGGVASGDSFSTSNSPLRGGKGYQWEGGIREPYFIKVPWLEKNIIDYPVTGADFYPTLLELAGLELIPKQHIDGVSLKPLLEENKTTLPGRPLFWHYPHYGNQGGDPSSIIRKANFKLIHYWEDNRNELYDLSADPGEIKDISQAKPEITNELWRELSKWLEDVNAEYPVKDSLFNYQEANLYKKKIRLELLTKLELERKEMFSKDFEPDPSWWNSKITVD
ncbi:sulfatase [Eudoraea sp.]|uniref:sulfatase n=1 Tax=Eudoraea sp. TaxID=1979955 RepID=UPI003C78DC0F